MDELSDTKIRNATPTDKEYAIADGQGLSVVVRFNLGRVIVSPVEQSRPDARLK
jgi:hypothetical protein